MIVAELYALLGVKPDSSWKEVKGLIGGVRRALIGLGAFAAGKRIFGFIEEAGESATHLVSLSQAMGLTIEQTQEWGYLAAQSGSNLKELSVGLNMFDGNLRKFSRGQGGKQLAGVMRDMGISVEDAKSAIASPEGLNALLLKTADRFKALGNNGNTAALARSLFSARAGRAMLADLSRGSDGIKQLQGHFRELGGEISGETAVNLRDMRNKIEDVKIGFHGLIMTVIGTLAPTITDLAERATKWMASHRELLNGVLTNAVNALAFAFKLVGDAIGVVATFIEDFNKGAFYARLIVDGLKYALIAMGVRAAVAWAMALGPIAGIVVAIGTVVEIVRFLADNLGTVPALAIAAGAALGMMATGAAGPWIGALAILTAIILAIKWIADHAGISFKGKMDRKTFDAKFGGEDAETQASARRLFGFEDTTAGSFDQTLQNANAAAAQFQGVGGPAAAASNVTQNVTNGNTTININGVKNADQAVDAMQKAAADEYDRRMRHTHRALTGNQ